MQVPLQVSSQTDDSSPVYPALVTAALTPTKFIPETPTLRVSNPPSPGIPLAFLEILFCSIVCVRSSVHMLCCSLTHTCFPVIKHHIISSQNHMLNHSLSSQCFNHHHHLVTAGKKEVRAGQPPHSQLCSCQCSCGGWRVCYISMEQLSCVCQ